MISWSEILKPFIALGSPFFPLVPDCSYCAAMRWALIAAVIAGNVVGFALHEAIWGTILGFGVGLVFVGVLYADYKWHNPSV